MSKIYIILLGMIFVFGTGYAEDNDDHSGHDHASESKHSEDDGHGHKKKKKIEKKSDHKGHDHSKGHDDQGKHDDHKGHDDHGEKKGHSDHDDHDDHGGGKAVGKGKAIEEVDEKKGFKLSIEAIKTLKLKLQTVNGDEFKIAKGTLVASKSVKGLYRFRGGFFKFLPVELLKEEKGKYLVKVKGVDFGDQIVIDGVGLLRVTDVYSTDKSEYGHSH